MKLGYKVKRFCELERFGFKYDMDNKEYIKRVKSEFDMKGFDDDYHSAYLVVDERTGKLFTRFTYGFSDEDSTFQWVHASVKIPIADIFELLEAGVITKF